MIHKPIKEDLTYMKIRPKKVDAPDVGTYKVHEAVTYVKKKNPGYTIGRSKSAKFTEEYSKNKKHIPGTGTYEWDRCVDKVVSRPYTRSRY